MKHLVVASCMLTLLSIKPTYADPLRELSDRTNIVNDLMGEWDFLQTGNKIDVERRWAFSSSGDSVAIREWTKNTGKKRAAKLIPKRFDVVDEEIIFVVPRREFGGSEEEEFVLRFETRDQLLGTSEYRGLAITGHGRVIRIGANIELRRRR